MNKTLVLLASLFCLSLAPFAGANTVNVFVIGECYDSATEGGEDAAGVSANTATLTVTPTVLTATGAVDAVGAFASEPDQVPSGNGCASSGNDRVTAGVTVDTVPVDANLGACYDATVRVTPCP